jgi:hypothetical protein
MKIQIVYIVIMRMSIPLICTKCTFYHGGKTLENSNTVKNITKPKKINIKKIQKKKSKKKMDFL